VKDESEQSQILEGESKNKNDITRKQSTNTGATSKRINDLTKDAMDFLKNAAREIESGQYLDEDKSILDEMHTSAPKFLKKMIEDVEALSMDERKTIVMMLPENNLQLSICMNEILPVLEDSTRRAIMAFISNEGVFMLDEMIMRSGRAYSAIGLYEVYINIFTRDPFARRALFIASLIPYVFTWYYAKKFLFQEDPSIGIAIMLLNKCYDESQSDPFGKLQ
jgi:hypothetical protein